MTITTAPCNFSQSTAKRRSRAGFSLVEILIGMTFATMLLASVMGALIFVLKSSYGIGNYVDMNMQSRQGVEQFGRDVRMAERAFGISPDSLVMRVKDVGFVRYTFVPGDNGDRGELVREELTGCTVSDGQLSNCTLVSRRVILQDVDAVRLTYYNTLPRDPDHDDPDEPPPDIAKGPMEVKMIRLDARMVRRVLQLDNTNHLISARFTMRNNDVGN